MKSLMPLSIWTRYNKRGASSRLRFFQYESFLRAKGFEPEYHPFFSDSYLTKLYSGAGKSFPELCRSWYRRCSELHADAPENPMLIEYELLPYLPEMMFLKNKRYVLNFDDAVDLRYRKLPVLKNKYPRLLHNAAGVIVANDELEKRFSRYNSNIIKLPTVPSVPPGNHMPKFEKLTVVWIGTPVTYPYLREHRHILRAMYQSVEFELLVIGGKALPPIPGVPTRCVDWSPESEFQLLQRSHIGIMPLPDTEFARGKSAYKLIQYLMAGIPAIASPVGENKNVLLQGKSGFLASSEAEWAAAIRQLADSEVRAAMRHSIESLAKNYSVGKTADELADFLHKCFQS